MANRKSDTSITDAVTRKHLEQASERDAIFCKKVTGFHLIKMKKGGAWRYRYTDTAGRRRVATIGRYPAMKPQQAAERAIAWRNDNQDVLADKARARQQALEQEALAKARTVGKYLDVYARHQARKKGGDETLQMIRRNFADWLDRDMASLTRADVLAWQERREAEGRAHATLMRAFSAVKTMLRHATRQDPPLLKENPLERVTLEPPADRAREERLHQRAAERRRPLTAEEIAALHAGLDAFAEEVRAQRRNSRAHGRKSLPDLDAVPFPHWFIPFAYVALFTGMRPGDIASLTWEEINPTFGRLVKVPQKTAHTPKPARIVMDIVDPLLTIIRDWHEQQGKPDTGLVFPSPVTGLALDKKAHQRPWARVKRLGGLPPDLTFYALRHHFVSVLVADGVPVSTVAKLVGHKSASMIEQHYGHLIPTVARDVMLRVAALNRGAA